MFVIKIKDYLCYSTVTLTFHICIYYLKPKGLFIKNNSHDLTWTFKNG